MNISAAIKLVLCISIAYWLVGCVQTKPVPGYARAGDNVVLGLGGIHRNGLSEDISTDDLTITITDSGGVVHNLQALQTFKSYPEYNSRMNASALSGSADSMGIMPFDGGWFVTVPLTVAGDTSTPLPLAEGWASISVTSPKLTNLADNNEGDLSALPIEIIAGVSSYDSDYNRQFTYYRPTNNNFLIGPDDLSGVNNVGGAYFVINYTDDSLFKPGIFPVALPSGHHPFVQLSYNVIEHGDGTGEIRITLLNPAGFTTFATSTNQTSLLADLSIKLLYAPASISYPAGTDIPAIYKAAFSLDLAQSYYIDINGDVISGLQPELTHVTDL
jgi:hypothetical protein